jgi:flagellar protein FliS
MNYQNVTDKYIDAQQGNSKILQLVLIYDGMIKIVKQATEAMKNNNIQEQSNLLNKAIQIIKGLQASLNVSKGLDMARVLHDYYHIIFLKIIKAQDNYDYTILENVTKELSLMRASWQEVAEKTSPANAPLNAEGSNFNTNYSV